MNGLSQTHHELLVEHARRPRHASMLSGDDILVTELRHPTCNDRVQVSIQLADDYFRAVGCVSSGCAISTASGSLMAERLTRVSRDEADNMYQMVRDALQRDAEPADTTVLGRAAAVVSVRAFPLRVKCALLPWLALARMLELDQSNQGPGAETGGRPSLEAEHRFTSI